MTNIHPRTALAYEIEEKGDQFLKQEIPYEDIAQVFSKIQATEKTTPGAIRYRNSFLEMIGILKIQGNNNISIRVALSLALTREVSQFTADNEKLSYFWFIFFEEPHHILSEYADYVSGLKPHARVYVRIKDHWPNSGIVQEVKIGKFLKKRWGYSDIECRVESVVQHFFEIKRRDS